ncbi:MAG: TIGR03435 family protein [Terriglobales bacterium]
MSPSRQRINFLLAALALATWAAAAQAPGARKTEPAITGNLPSFDVVSIRPLTAGRGGAWANAPDHGRWTTRGIPVSFLVSDAFGVPLARIEGLPKWAIAYRLRIIAKTNPDVAQPQFHQMLQSLLASRFAFSGHWDSRTMNVRALRAAPGGVKVQPVSGHCAPYGADPAAGEQSCGRVLPHRTFPDSSQWKNSQDISSIFELRGYSVTMADVAEYLGENGEPMVDQTGYKGSFDFDLKFTEVMHKIPNGMADPDWQRQMAAALRDQVGLVVQEAKAPIRVLVVDHVAKPTAN